MFESSYQCLLILYHFRKEREKRAGYEGKNLEEEQYLWCANRLNEKIEKVKPVIDKWIFDHPNGYLKKCMFPGVNEFFAQLKSKGIKTAIYSDYNSASKLEHMQIHADFVLSSTDKRVNSFKPLPNGLNVILNETEVTDKKNCLFIGDRFELDGKCAENAEIPFLLIDKEAAIKGYYLKLSTMLINLKNKVAVDAG